MGLPPLQPMAKAGDKKRLEQNARHIKRLQALIGGANVSLARAAAASWKETLRSALRIQSASRTAAAPVARRHATLRAAGAPARALLSTALPLCSPLCISLCARPQAAFLVFRLILGRATAGAWLYAGFALTSLVYAGCYKMISGALGEGSRGSCQDARGLFAAGLAGALRLFAAAAAAASPCSRCTPLPPHTPACPSPARLRPRPPVCLQRRCTTPRERWCTQVRTCRWAAPSPTSTT